MIINKNRFDHMNINNAADVIINDTIGYFNRLDLININQIPNVKILNL